ncbi:MAG: mechanosensitive ion channel family protein [Microcoleaceae cyanobacterium]
MNLIVLATDFSNLDVSGNVVNIGAALLLSLFFSLTFLLLAGLSYLQFPKLAESLIQRFSSSTVREIYQTIIIPYQNWIAWLLILIVIDLAILGFPVSLWIRPLEFPLGLVITANTIWLGFRIFRELFDSYLLGIALDDKSKINSELLALGKFLAQAAIMLITIFLFAQAHHINLIGLVASLGVGGVAVAFASQKVLEQILWSIVLYIDRPFTVDDYIHLPDGTLGRVESIGWRSTKIRLSGKNTLVIVPNSNLAQITIENLTGAKRVILLINLTFFRAMSDEEKALIRQLILDSTSDILGIDHGLTQVNFQNAEDEASQSPVKAQIIFFILGTAETSMDLRRNLLQIARENILERLQEYGIVFTFEQDTVDITQPMSI